MLCRQKSRVVVQGFPEVDSGADKAAPAASQQSAQPMITDTANVDFVLRQVGTKTIFIPVIFGIANNRVLIC